MNLDILYQWTNELAMQLPGLNSWQAANLALFSYGVIEAESSQQMKIARKVVCGEQTASAEKRLRRFIANEGLELSRFFVEWTTWMLRCLEGQRVVLLVDETKLADRLALMVVGLAFEGRCIPLAWRCYRANDASAYPAEGQVELIAQLLAIVKQGISPTTSVLLLADRGIGTSPELCKRVAGFGWHYLFRVTKQSKIITTGGDYTIYEQVEAGHTWAARGLIFKKRGRIPAYARAVWQDGYDEPWALVTNDEQLTGFEYAQRNWQEQSFRDLKSGGWQWATSRVRCPERMARLMMILVVAYGWILGLGSYAIHWRKARRVIVPSDGKVRRQWSLFKEGLQLFTDYVSRTGVCLKPCFVPDKRLC
jgi:hypothetical protein